MPPWAFETAGKATESSRAAFEKFLEYRAEGDFVGMDVAGEYLQMGWTRARRYARYEGGDKKQPLEKEDPEKARAAEVFREKWREAAEDEEYLRLEERHERRNP